MYGASTPICVVNTQYTAFLEANSKACVEIWHPTLGIHQEIEDQSHSDVTAQNTSKHRQYAIIYPH